MPRSHAARPKPSPLLVIALLKLGKAALLAVVATGVLRMTHHDVRHELTHLARMIHADPANHFVEDAIAKVSGMSVHELQAVGVAGLLYAALFATEGVGLLLKQRWAEHLTVISTALLLPIEVYEVFHHLTAIKILVIAVNVVISIYLIGQLRAGRTRQKAAAAIHDPASPSQ